LSTPTGLNNPYENYYNATSYLAPYHTHAAAAHLNSLNHNHLTNQNGLHSAAAAAQTHHYRHLQAADYMNADYNAIQRTSAADMWAYKFHGL
jgi:hypothetical protein